MVTFTKLFLFKGDLKKWMEKKLKSSGIPGDLFEIMVSESMSFIKNEFVCELFFLMTITSNLYLIFLSHHLSISLTLC